MLHYVDVALGRSIAFHLTLSNAADCKACGALIGQRERPPGRLVADEGQDAEAIRADMAGRNIKAVIPYDQTAG